ncbi:uncharacterized protein LOC110933061 [Helianthus annuus]|uniref:uncharacterized protein LOC110933061 n=1 Tax=Helianthus annuus TaxID=4232 RepID=UPI000B8FAB3E|nr:uncharacterized protein LOC110933061 [Helianthus annuus]
MDPTLLSYGAYLSGSNPFFPSPYGVAQPGGSQPPQEQAEPEVDTVSETQPELDHETSKRGRRSHKKKETDAPRRKGSYLVWTKDEEYALARAWLNVSEDSEQTIKLLQHFGSKFVSFFFNAMGKGEYRDNDSISSKWTDLNHKCHQFQEVYQRTKDNWPSRGGDVDILTRAMEEYDKTRVVFTYYRCWELLKNSPKWANVPTMTSSSRRKAKRSKTSSSVDPETPTSDARTVDLNVILDDDEEDEELSRPPGRREEKKPGKKPVESSSNNLELKGDFEEMNQRLQDIRDLGHKRWETMQERLIENKKFNEMQAARQTEKDIDFLSKPIDHLQGDALIVAQMHRQKLREKYGL